MTIPRPRPSIVFAALGMAVLLSTGNQVHATSELPITGVKVVSEGPADAAAVTEILGLRVGQPIDRRQLRTAIHTIYARADVEWLRIESTATSGGIDIVVTVNLRTTLERIEVRTRNPVFKKRVEKWLELTPGQRVSASLLDIAQRRVARRLRDRGHADASVDLYLDYRRSSNTADLTVQVVAGDPRTLSEVVVSGDIDPGIAGQAVPETKPNLHLTARSIERLRLQTETSLRRLGYWDAQVRAVERELDGPVVSLEMVADPGPMYELELRTPEGFDKIVREAIPDPGDEDLHPAQTAALAEKIRERLQDEGYLLATVAVELDTTALPQILSVDADPGRIRRVGELEFPGAESIAIGRLRESVRVRPGPVRGLRGRSVSDATLERDRQALTETYHSYGFVDVAISPALLEPLGEDAVSVRFPIEEGHRWTLTELRVEGLPVEAAAGLEKTTLSLAEATPWNPGRVETARRQVELVLANAGYPEGRVSAEVDTSTTGQARVVFRAEPGAFVEIGQVVIAGLSSTREGVVAKTIRRAGVETGEPFARDRILLAQRRLYELGLFRRVELLPMPGQERSTQRGLVVNLEEGRQKSYLFGVGWNETDRFRITLGWSHLNLLGGAHAFSAETRLSGREQRFQVGIREHRLPWLNVPGYMAVYRTFEEFATYSQRRSGLWFEVGDRRRIGFRPWLRYEYQIVQPNAPPDVLSELERENQEALISSITPTLEFDYRDNPLVPTGGTFSSVSLEYAFPAFSANSEFLKLQGRFTVYSKFLNGIGAAGFRIGAIEPLGPDTGEPANLQVPLNTRFFSGGASSHRGFETDFLGIPGQTIDEDGNPIGGNALVLINFEYQRPIQGIFSIVVFLDVGNVWADWSLVRTEDLRYVAGLGLRLDTPAGPLRAEYGYKLDRVAGESAGEFFLSFGIPF